MALHPEGCEPRSIKKCSKCKVEKSVEDFHRSLRNGDGLQHVCKPCHKIRMTTPEMMERRKRASWLRCLKGFGITEADYIKMFDEQMGVCAICHRPENGIKLAVDHCHDTGRVRGLLCKRCNMAIGLLGDNPDTAMNAAIYMRRAQIG